MFGAVRTFQMKLIFFRKQFEDVKLCHFPSCDLLRKDGSLSAPFLSVRIVEMIDSFGWGF